MDRPTPTAIELATIAAPFAAAGCNDLDACAKAAALIESAEKLLKIQTLESEFYDQMGERITFDDALARTGYSEQELTDAISAFFEAEEIEEGASGQIEVHKRVGIAEGTLELYRKALVSKKRREAAKRRWEK